VASPALLQKISATTKGSISQPFLALAVDADIAKALGLAEHGAHRDHQDVDEPMLDLPPAAQVLDSFQLGDQGFKHAFPSAAKGQA
jgi:hypothetical protein